MTVDLRQASFETLRTFVFDHPSYAEGRIQDAWWHDETLDLELLTDPRRQIAFMTQLFEAPGALVERFTPAQIDQAFWYMCGANGAEHFADHLWNADVPWDERRASLSAIAGLYSTLFRDVELGEAPFMLWDLLAFGYDCGNRRPAERVEDRRVQEAMLEELMKLLEADDSSTQRAALHGLGHLSHPAGRGVVEGFLASGRWIEPEIREYAQGIAAGRIL